MSAPFRRLIRKWLPIVGQSLVVVASVVGALALVGASWWYAHPSRQQGHERLRWHAVATTALQRGSRLRPGDFELRLGRVFDDSTYPSGSHLDGHFAIHDLSKGTPITEAAIAAVHPILIERQEAIVGVLVSSDDAGRVRPGAHVAFIGDSLQFPPTRELAAGTRRPYRVRVAMPSAADSNQAIIEVSIPRAELHDVRRLLSGTWRMIILDSGIVAPQQRRSRPSSPTPAKRGDE